MQICVISIFLFLIKYFVKKIHYFKNKNLFFVINLLNFIKIL